MAIGPTAGATTTDNVSVVRVEEESKQDVTTKFVGSLVVEKNDDRVTTFDPPNYIKSMTTEFIMTLKKALCRPVTVTTGTWQTVDAQGANLYVASIPENLLALPIFNRKLDGFQGIRGSITYRLQVTANPFQQGCLKLLWYPMFAQDPTATGRSAAVESWSYWPSVDIDLSKETAGELRVPFVMPVAFCDLVTAVAANRPQMGQLFIKVYSPLQTGAGTNIVGWKLYGHWNEDDLQLINPTTNSYQSGETRQLTKPVSLDETLAKICSLDNVDINIPMTYDHFVQLRPDFQGFLFSVAVAIKLGLSREEAEALLFLQVREKKFSNLRVHYLAHSDSAMESLFRLMKADDLVIPSQSKVLCLQCSRHFKTFHALQQHTVDKHPGTMDPPEPPQQAQSGSTKTLSTRSKLPSEVEKKNDSISGALSTTASVLDLAAHVPILADLAGPTAWAVRCASKAAAAFGFSRTPIDEVPRIVSRVDMPYNATVEGPDVSMPLSLSLQPTLRIEPKLSGKNEDEMAIDYFLTKFGYHTTLNLATSQPSGTLLWNKLMGPFEATAQEAIYPKPYQALARMFKYWRGNFRIRLKFVKTKMHVARLVIAFFPGRIVNAAITDCEYPHREIVDLAEVDELVYELPFTSQFPYLSTRSSDAAGAYGSFQILIDNPLQAPAAVANNINIIVELAMGEGAEFFEPGTLTDLVPQIPQSGQTKGLVKISTLAEAQLTGAQEETAQLCVGEKMLSLRQLIKYPGNIAYSRIFQDVAFDGSGETPRYFFKPFMVGSSLPTGLSSVRFRDFLSVLQPYFRFFRGGMRVRMILEPSNTVVVDYGIVVATAGANNNNGVTGTDPIGAPMWGGDWKLGADQAGKYTIPAWQVAPMVPLFYSTTATPSSAALIDKQTAFQWRSVRGNPSVTGIAFYQRQPADDYELISFLGPAQLVLATA